MYATLTQLATDFERLPEFLPTDTAPRLDTMGRTGTKVHAAIPIRVDVSDLLAAIAIRAVQWEAALRETFTMGAPYWTKPRPVAVPASLRWSAGILADPPMVECADGFDRPGLIPDDVAAWIAASSIALADQCSRVIQSRITIRRTTCPRCDCPTLFSAPDGNTRCVRCGVAA